MKNSELCRKYFPKTQFTSSKIDTDSVPFNSSNRPQSGMRLGGGIQSGAQPINALNGTLLTSSHPVQIQYKVFFKSNYMNLFEYSSRLFANYLKITTFAVRILNRSGSGQENSNGKSA